MTSIIGAKKSRTGLWRRKGGRFKSLQRLPQYHKLVTEHSLRDRASTRNVDVRPTLGGLHNITPLPRTSSTADDRFGTSRYCGLHGTGGWELMESYRIRARRFQSQYDVEVECMAYSKKG